MNQRNPQKKSQQDSSEQGTTSFLFLAHPVQCVDAPFMWLKSLGQKAVVNWWWLWLLWPVWFAVSLWYLIWPRSFNCTDNYRFGIKLRGHSWLVRNFAWNYLVPALRPLVSRRLGDAVLAAQEQGIDVVGLGALNKAEWLNGGGAELVQELGDRLRIPVVHGDTMTAAAVYQLVLQVMAAQQHPRTRVFITGGTSKTGRALALALMRRGTRVRLLTTSASRFKEIRSAAGGAGHLLSRAESLEQGHDCQLWITGKAVPAGARLRDEIPIGAAVVNFSVPDPLRPEDLQRRSDLLHLDAGLLAYDPDKTDMWFTLGLRRGLLYACHAGTIVHAHRGWRHHEVGEVDVERMDEVWAAAMELGLRLPNPTSHHRPVNLRVPHATLKKAA